MGFWKLFMLVFVTWVLFISGTQQLQTSQTQVLLQLRKHLEFPIQLEVMENYNGDLCNLSSYPHITIACEDNSVTELKIMGDKVANVSEFKGTSIPNQTLSESFSIDSFVTTLTRLTGLRVLTLVSLGIWGQLPDKIHRLYSLEVLDLSSNFLYGSIPQSLSRVVKLQTLMINGNFFNETIPDWFDSLSNLTVLSLKGNRFKGQFPSSICRIKTLTNVALSRNELSGKLPDLSTLTSLHVLDLRENRLNSELPAMPRGLVTALLSNNSFLGKIPEHFGKLDQLQHLDLSFNSLVGTIPSELFALPRISYLNLASNMLSGSLMNHLTCGSQLGFVDISTNKLTGELPSCLSTNSNNRVVIFDGNCLSIDTHHQNQESYCKEVNEKAKHSSGKNTALLVGVSVGTGIFIVLLVLGVFVFCRSFRSREKRERHIVSKAVQDNSPAGISSELLTSARLISQAAKLGTDVPSYRAFSVDELSEATNNFEDSAFLGEGSIGKMYKGRLENGIVVAIRCLTLFKKYSIRNLRARLDMLSKLHHPHLVGLLGHCIDDGGQEDATANSIFIIYEYVPNGNFHTHLAEDCPEKIFKWSDRLAVLIGAAKAVHFLHTGMIPGSFNNRLKTNNILLDEHRIPKLTDYGMSIILEDTEKFDAKGEGTKPGQMTKFEDDVYGFGFILLESLVGPVLSGKGEEFLLNEMVSFGSQDGRRKIVDPIVLTTSTQESLSIVISITNKCISTEPSTRPSFEDVLWNLQYAAQVQASADADLKSDATSQS